MIRFTVFSAAAMLLTFFAAGGPGVSALQAQTPVPLDVEVSNDEPVQGEVVAITFSADDAEGFFFYGLEVVFNQDQFTFLDVEPGELMGESPLKIADNLDESRIGASVVRTSGSGDGTGTVATFLFQVNENVTGGTSEFLFQNVDLRDTSGGSLPVEVAASVTVTPQEVDTFTVYYNNPDEWTDVYTYAFSSTGGEYISFPGELMNEPPGGTVWYSYDVPVTFDRVIFNNNAGDQTGDLERNTDGWFDGNQWYDQEPDFDAERPVTFRVDMSVQMARGNFDPETDVINVAGSFSDWSSLPMEEAGDDIYTLTVDVTGPETATAEFKFVLNSTFELEGEPNRQFSLGPDGESQILPVFFYDNDEGEDLVPDSRPVTFSVDMSIQEQLGNFDPDAGDIVYVTGDFNDFSTDNPLTAAGDMVFETTIDIQGTEGATREYKYFIEAGDERELPNDGWELLNDDPDLNRVLTLGEADSPQILDTVFFNNEDEVAPDPDTRPITFSVDMSVQEQLGNFDPETETVFVRGIFNDFSLDNPLTEEGEGVYSATFEVEGEEGSVINYKFYYGIDEEDGTFEGNVGDGGPFNEDRELTLGPADEPQILDTVFFNNEEDTPPELVTVWPGDTNNDGVVNEEDVLPLGVFWNQTGPARDDASLEWTGQPAEPWDPAAATYADTDGSGSINQTDLLAVGLNFGETHGESRDTEPALAELNLPSVQAGDRFIVTLSAADWLDIQGVSFAFELEGVEEESFTLSEAEAAEWAEVWIDENRLLEFSLIDAHRLSGAKVHKGQTEPVSTQELIRFEIDATQTWANGALLLVNRASIIDGQSAQQSLDEVVVEYTLETGTGSETEELPRTTALHQNYPNPFNPTTNIVFDLSEQAAVTIEVVNILGQRVAMLADREEMQAGTHTSVFDGSRLTSGVYLIRMQAGSQQFTRKMMLVK